LGRKWRKKKDARGGIASPPVSRKILKVNEQASVSQRGGDQTNEKPGQKLEKSGKKELMSVFGSSAGKIGA